MLRWIINLFNRSAGKARKESRPSRARIIARYDAAQTTDENSEHWSNADGYSANGQITAAVRKKLRERARYEVQNNGYARGLVSTLANDIVGTGPRLQVRLPDGFEVQARQIVALFRKWSRSISLADKLRIMHESRVRDGECFGAFITNPALDQFAVQLDLKLIETDQVESPYVEWADPLHVDGIVFDTHGNVIEYHVLRSHPGEIRGIPHWGDYDRVPSGSMLHWFRPERPGQARGVPEITAALPLFAMLRRYTLATMTAAETAAMIAGVMTTDQPADAGAEVEVEAMDAVDLKRGSLLTLPNGWDASQFSATQPVNTYEMFKAEVLNEIGRSVNAPYNTVAGNSSKYNYSSARLDHQIYHRSIWIERERMEDRVLNRLFRAWLNESTLLPGYLPAGLPPFASWEWEWNWDGFLSADPQKDVAADQMRLAAGMMTLAEYYASQGQDWQEALSQLKREAEFAAEMGVKIGGATGG